MDLASIRKHRIYDIALFDLISATILSVAIMLIIHRLYFNNMNNTYFILFGIIITIPVGIVIHKIFKINTTLNYKLGLSDKPNL